MDIRLSLTDEHIDGICAGLVTSDDSKEKLEFALNWLVNFLDDRARSYALNCAALAAREIKMAELAKMAKPVATA